MKLFKPRTKIIQQYIGHLTNDEACELTKVSLNTVRKLRSGEKVSQRILSKVAKNLKIPHVDNITHYKDLEDPVLVAASKELQEITDKELLNK